MGSEINRPSGATARLANKMPIRIGARIKLPKARYLGIINKIPYVDNINLIDCHRDINQFIVSEMQVSPKKYNEYLRKLLNSLLLKTKNESLHYISEKWIASNEIFLKMVNMQPIMAFEELKRYNNKKGIQKQQCAELLDVFSIRLIILSVKPEIHQTILKFNTLLEDITNQHTDIDASLSRKLLHELIFDCFNRMLDDSLQTNNHSEVLIDSLLSSYYKFDFKAFFDLFFQLFEHPKIGELKLSKSYIANKKKQIFKAKKDYKSQLKYKVNDNKQNKLLVSKIAQSLSLHEDLSYSRLFNDFNLDALYPNTEVFCDSSIEAVLKKEGEQFLKEDRIILEEKLKTAFLKVLLSYELHSGDKQYIVEQFNTVATYYIDALRRQKSKVKDKYIRNGKTITGDGNDVIIDDVFSDIELTYKAPNKSLNTKVKRDNFKELINLGILLSPDTIRGILANNRPTKAKINALRNVLSFEEFINAMCHNLYGNPRVMLLSLHTIYRIVGKLNSKLVNSSFELDVWTLALKSIYNKTYNNKKLEILTSNIIQKLADANCIETNDIIKVIEGEEMVMTPTLKECLLKKSPYFKVLNVNCIEEKPSDIIISSYENNYIEELCYTLITQNKVSIWYDSPKSVTSKQILYEIIEYYPYVVLKILKLKKLTASQLIKFNEMIELPELVTIMSRLNSSKNQSLKHVKTFYEVLNSIYLRNSFPYEVEHTFFKILVEIWTTSNWKLIQPESILNRVLWSLCYNSQIKKKDVLKALQIAKMQLPVSFQLALNLLLETSTMAQGNITKEEIVLKTILQQSEEKPLKITNGIKINNAGLVLVNNYIPHLFKYLDLTENEEFISIDKQLDAVHYLQYVATGVSKTEESYLVLNKILCGFHPTEPVLDGVNISESHCNLISEMIETIISHWPSIGKSSVEGFMGNWLIRDGVLFEEDDKWKLKIEKKAYDILINSSPFSFSIINHQWMNKPLYVEWPY